MTDEVSKRSGTVCYLVLLNCRNQGVSTSMKTRQEGGNPATKLTSSVASGGAPASPVARGVDLAGLGDGSAAMGSDIGGEARVDGTVGAFVLGGRSGAIGGSGAEVMVLGVVVAEAVGATALAGAPEKDAGDSDDNEGDDAHDDAHLHADRSSAVRAPELAARVADGVEGWRLALAAHIKTGYLVRVHGGGDMWRKVQRPRGGSEEWQWRCWLQKQMLGCFILLKYVMNDRYWYGTYNGPAYQRECRANSMKLNRLLANRVCSALAGLS